MCDSSLEWQIFFYSWLVISFMVLFNIFIAIMMESYASAKVPLSPHLSLIPKALLM